VEQPLHNPTPPNEYLVSHDKRTLRQDLLTLDPTALELGMGALAIGWALWLMLPFSSFGTVPSLALLRILGGADLWGNDIAEYLWMAVAFGIGYGQWRAARMRRHRARRALCFGALLFWLILSVALFAGNGANPTIGLTVVLAAKNAWAHLRNGKNRDA
jgi:hypothetical protein